MPAMTPTREAISLINPRSMPFKMKKPIVAMIIISSRFITNFYQRSKGSVKTNMGHEMGRKAVLTQVFSGLYAYPFYVNFS